MKRDRRTEKTEAAIKNALASVLQHHPLKQASVSEVARIAGVSRSTFYAHYTGLDQVYGELVRDMDERILQLRSQLRSPDTGTQMQRQPFCSFLRSAGSLNAIVSDDQYLPALFEQADKMHAYALYDQLVKDGLPTDAASALFRFQMGGCYMAATSLPSTADWTKARETIDAFVRGGIAAVRATLS